MSTTHRADHGSAFNPEHFRRVKAVVQAAFDLAPDDRPAFLDGACGGDAAFRHDVETLLAAAESDGSFLERSAAADAGLGIAEADDLAPRLASELREQYQIERELEGGGMSRVFLALELSPRRQVVLKVLRQDLLHGSVARFAREVELMASLQQANIAPVLRVGEVCGLPYYTMRYEGGGSLRALLASGEPPLAQALGILRDIARALAYAHTAGVVHRDIKPENVLLSGRTAVVTDFGIAKALTAARGSAKTGIPTGAITSEGISIGTPAYMSPEQTIADPSIGPSSDIYSFGVLAYELLTGAHPFGARLSPRDYLAAHRFEAPRPIGQLRPALPSRVAALVMRCLAKEPADRPRDGEELLVALEGAESAPAPASWDADAPSLAVLPFDNQGSSADPDYFADGVAVEIVSALTRIPGLRVAARTSSFSFRERHVSLRAVASQLEVKALLEGNVRRVGNRVRITAWLVSAGDERTLWTEQYEREVSDVLGVQGEVARSIASEVQRTLTGGVGHPSTNAERGRSESLSPEATELYLRGRHLLEKRADGMRDALHCFEEAARLDPGFSRPYAGIACAFNLFGLYHELRPREAFPRARAAADRALAIDPTDAFALVMRAHVALWYEWDFARAEELARRALELAPGFHLAHDGVGFALAAQGRFEEAIAAMQRARALDPLSEFTTYDLAWILILAGRYQQAIRELQPALERHPQVSELHRAFGFALFYAGRQHEARAELERVLELSVGDRWGSTNLVQALAALDERGEARRLVGEIEQRAPHEPIPPLGIAIMHHWLGDDDAAVRWLERSIEARDYWLVMLRFDPSMSRLRENPRFASLMQRVRPDRSA
jgi:serine/threonine-protein kinase